MFKLSFVIAFTFKMFCSFGPYCCVAPDVPWGVCVCFASVWFGRRTAPCYDCVYSFVTPCPAHTQLALLSDGWSERGGVKQKEKTDRGQEQSRLISCSLTLSHSISCYRVKEDMLFKFKPHRSWFIQ